VRGWAVVTAVLTGTFAFAFFIHERPPTPGHLAAGIFIAVPTLVLIVAMAGLPSSAKTDRRVLFLQAITTTTAASAELSQHLSIAVRVLGVALLVVPCLIAANRLRQVTSQPR
jgi:predicted cobalt transporter CbtA